MKGVQSPTDAFAERFGGGSDIGRVRGTVARARPMSSRNGQSTLFEAMGAGLNGEGTENMVRGGRWRCLERGPRAGAIRGE